jgi:hypothetical protein
MDGLEASSWMLVRDLVDGFVDHSLAEPLDGLLDVLRDGSVLLFV